MSLRHRKQVVLVSTKKSFREMGSGDDGDSDVIVAFYPQKFKNMNERSLHYKIIYVHIRPLDNI